MAPIVPTSSACEAQRETYEVRCDACRAHSRPCLRPDHDSSARRDGPAHADLFRPSRPHAGHEPRFRYRDGVAADLRRPRRLAQRRTVAPMLAKSVDVSPDGLTYTFTLRDGVKFHNGASLTSREVVWTWKRFLDPTNNWSCRANFDGTRQIHIVSVEAKDDKTVVFRLEKPAGALLTTMARSDCDSTGIAHPDSVDTSGAFTLAMGTGPFRLSEWKKGEYVELERFADYSSRTEPTDGLAGAKKALVDKLRF